MGDARTTTPPRRASPAGLPSAGRASGPLLLDLTADVSLLQQGVSCDDLALQVQALQHRLGSLQFSAFARRRPGRPRGSGTLANASNKLSFRLAAAMGAVTSAATDMLLDTSS